MLFLPYIMKIMYWRNIILDMQDSSIRHVPEPLAIYNIHNNSLTANKFLSFYWLYKAFVFSSVKTHYNTIYIYLGISYFI